MPSEPFTLGVLFAVAILASAVDAIAGGGGLLTVPALLLVGLDPASAIATNKVQSSFGATSATVVFLRRGVLGWPSAWVFVIAGAMFAALGALGVALLRKDVLSALVPFMLIGVALYFVMARAPREAEADARLSPLVFAVLCVGPIGFYDGIFGPGTGSFLMIGFVILLGFGLVKATAHAKLVNAASNIGALACFALTGKVVWPLGLVMAGGALIGGQIGSRLALWHGARLIRPLLVTVCCAIAVRLLADPANPVRHLIAAVVTRMHS